MRLNKLLKSMSSVGASNSVVGNNWGVKLVVGVELSIFGAKVKHFPD